MPKIYQDMPIKLRKLYIYTISSLILIGVLASSIFPQENIDSIIQASPPENKDIERKVVEWMKENAIPIKSASSDSFEELYILSGIFEDKSLVLLGEGSHGTKEFFQVKDKLVRYLIKNHGFKNLGMEYDMVDGLPMQKYLQTGFGDVENALNQQRGWVWNTREILEMSKWLQNHNKSSKNKVNYFGVDMLRIIPPLVYSIDFLKSQNVSEANEIEKKLQDLSGGTLNEFQADDDKFYDQFSGVVPIKNNYQLKELMLLLVDLFDIYEDKISLQTSAEIWEINKRIAITAYQKSKHLLQWNMNNIFPTFGNKKQNEIYGRAANTSKYLRQFYKDNDPVQYKAIEPVLNLIENPYRGNREYRKLSINNRGNLKDTVFSSIARLDIRREYYLKGVKEDQLLDVKNNLNLILSIFEIYKDYLSKPAMSTNEREIGLAENTQWLYETKGKTIIWAHNGHVSKNANRETDMMGTILRNKYKDKMLVIGTTFNKGKFQAAYSVRQTNANTSQLQEFNVSEAKKNSLEYLMAQVGHPIFLIDFRKLPKNGVVKEWFSKEHFVRSIGNSYNPENPDNYYEFIGIPKHYDAMIFFNESTRAEPTKYIVNKYDLN